LTAAVPRPEVLSTIISGTHINSMFLPLVIWMLYH